MFDSRDADEGRPTLRRPVGPVQPPPGRFGVSLGIAAPRGGQMGPVGRALALVGGAAIVAALYVWDDLLLAAPIVAVASLWGPFQAWLLFAALYAGASFVLSMWMMSIMARSGAASRGRFARWLHNQTDGRRGRWGRALINGGQIIGFVAASFLLGAIVTTWLTRVARPDQPALPVAASSAAIFGVTFAAQYAGIAALFV